MVKGILRKTNPLGKIAKWIVALLEYDIDINPTKLIKRQEIIKMMRNSNYEYLQLNLLTSHSNQLDIEVQVIPDFSISPWYSDIVYVLQNLQATAGLRKTRERSVKLNMQNFVLWMNNYIEQVLVFY